MATILSGRLDWCGLQSLSEISIRIESAQSSRYAGAGVSEWVIILNAERGEIDEHHQERCVHAISRPHAKKKGERAYSND